MSMINKYAMLTSMMEPVHISDKLKMLRDMLFIRLFEEEVANLLEEGKIRCPTHLYIGQEAVAVGVCAALCDDDWVFSTHRSHGHFLAKGGDPKALLDELFCRDSGCSHGFGGSMHVIDLDHGLPGSAAIVGGTIPLAVGAAYSFKLEDAGRVAVAFFGDGAACEGVLYEALNLAALWDAPVIFVLENNLFSTHLRVDACHAQPDFVRKAEAFGVPGVAIDGNDAVSVFRAARFAVGRARKGRGPFFIEARTYRWRGHVGPNPDVDKGIRSREELDFWMERCPIKRLRADLWTMRKDDSISLIEDGVERRIRKLFGYDDEEV